MSLKGTVLLFEWTDRSRDGVIGFCPKAVIQGELERKNSEYTPAAFLRHPPVFREAVQRAESTYANSITRRWEFVK